MSYFGLISIEGCSFFPHNGIFLKRENEWSRREFLRTHFKMHLIYLIYYYPERGLGFPAPYYKLAGKEVVEQLH